VLFRSMSSSKSSVVSNRFPWNLISGFIDTILSNRFIVSYVKILRATLLTFGVPQELLPSVDQVVLCSSVVVGTLGSYWYWLGRKHQNLRRQLKEDLSKAHQAVRELETKLISIEALEEKLKQEEGKEIRIFMDGAFDMMHYGHMNAFRKARALGTYLVAGINSDESITICKGPPICNDDERISVVRGCKWVDEVVEKVPYVMTAEYLDWVIKTYKIDFVVHGDDPCIVDGKDVYEIPKRNGQFKSISRTEGISTTDIVGRMLLCTRSHHSDSISDSEGVEGTSIKSIGDEAYTSKSRGDESFEYRKTDFLTTMNVIRLFGASVKPPEPTARVVYVAGSWDMFHGAHVHLLEKARQFGDYLIVGVHNDGVINNHLGMNYPIMNMQERALSVIGCKFVDDVLIDAPYDISATMIASLKITAVVRGSIQPQGERQDPIDEEFKSAHNGSADSVPRFYPYQRDPYKVPRERGMLHVVPSVSGLTAADIVERIHAQHERYKSKFAKKKAAEDEYYKERYEVEAAELAKNVKK